MSWNAGTDADAGGAAAPRSPGTVLATDAHHPDPEAVPRLIDHRLVLECGITGRAADRGGRSPVDRRRLRPGARELQHSYPPYPLDTLRSSRHEHRALLDTLRRRDAVAAEVVARQHAEVLHRTVPIGLLADR
ncbi:hypothetical protein [Streptomyces enissocaesilis]|uniref:hypothetical protein n=1 Tax=Streptomyces enissocaesilis TaxID=332589 RepID=UPI0031E2558B